MRAMLFVLAAMAALVATLGLPGAARAQADPNIPPPGAVLDANTLSETACCGSGIGGALPRLPGVSFSMAQTFTAENSGEAVGTVLEVGGGTGGSPLLVRLMGLDGSGAPDEANILAGAEIPASSVFAAEDPRIQVLFPNRPRVVAGTGYAISLSTAADSTYGWSFASNLDTSDPYDGGAAFSRRDSDPWQPYEQAQKDAIFGLYVDPNAAPTISPLSPRPGSATLDRTPTIRATVRDDSGDLLHSRIRLTVDGRLRSFSYTAGKLDRLTKTLALAPGRHAIRISAIDAFGKSATRSWSFTVKKRP